MPAIITDQLRILNAKKFVSDVNSNEDTYYAFIGLPNPFEYNVDWNNSPFNPRDNFDLENDYWDTMLGVSKILPSNVRQVVPKIEWETGTTYDMYRHDISIDNPSSSQSTSLYSSNFYVINKDLNVYICLDNGASPENNFEGNPSLDEPTFTGLDPKVAGTSGDGYIWKYLYTISPSDLIKFDSIFFITTPLDWETSSDYQAIRNHAINSGQIKIVKIKDRGDNVLNSGTYTNVPIYGDGTDAECTVVVNEQLQIDSVTVSNGGSRYTYGTLDLSGLIDDQTITKYPEFDVIIPPTGGHGYDIYRELGASSILLYTRIENDSQNPDFIVGNQVARFGIVQNPAQYTGLGPENSETLLTDTSASTLYALKLNGDIAEASFPEDSYVTQSISQDDTAVGRVVSYNKTTGVLKYWQDRRLVGFNTDGSRNRESEYGFIMHRFTSSPDTGGDLSIFVDGIDSGLVIDDTFGTPTTPATVLTLNNGISYSLGQSFIGGISNPEVEKYSGNIIYVDNRAAITRSQNQKEDIKVILQF